MADPATALLALWNDVDPALDALYNEWHAVEHVPERLTVPGFLWARRYGRTGATTTAPRYLTLYGLRDAAVLDGEPYQRLLRVPTATSRRMRPALVNLSRWVCKLVEAGELDRGSRLAVWTSAGTPVAAGAGLGRLVGRRLPQAAALPWLQSGQSSRPVEGDWLVCLASDAGAVNSPTVPPPVVYTRLPVGPASTPPA